MGDTEVHFANFCPTPADQAQAMGMSMLVGQRFVKEPAEEDAHAPPAIVDTPQAMAERVHSRHPPQDDEHDLDIDPELASMANSYDHWRKKPTVEQSNPFEE